MIIINKTQVRALVNSALNYSLIDSQLQCSLGIKSKEKEQLIIAQNIHQQEIARIISQTKTVIIKIQQHEKQIQFDKISMSKQKITLESNWLIKHNPTID